MLSGGRSSGNLHARSLSHGGGLGEGVPPGCCSELLSRGSRHVSSAGLDELEKGSRGAGAGAGCGGALPGAPPVPGSGGPAGGGGGGSRPGSSGCPRAAARELARC